LYDGKCVTVRFSRSNLLVEIIHETRLRTIERKIKRCQLQKQLQASFQHWRVLLLAIEWMQRQANFMRKKLLCRHLVLPLLKFRTTLTHSCIQYRFQNIRRQKMKVFRTLRMAYLLQPIQRRVHEIYTPNLYSSCADD
jgi:hypothetical protein